MKRVMRLMTILMGFSMSLVLSLVGTVSGGHFTVPSWGISFGISLVISLFIGFIVPVKRVCDGFCDLCKVNPNSMKGNLLGGVISDLIYTPIITVIMVYIMVSNAAKHAPAGVMPPMQIIMVKSLIITLLVGYVVIIVLQPIFIKLLTRRMPDTVRR